MEKNFSETISSVIDRARSERDDLRSRFDSGEFSSKRHHKKLKELIDLENRVRNLEDLLKNPNQMLEAERLFGSMSDWDEITMNPFCSVDGIKGSISVVSPVRIESSKASCLGWGLDVECEGNQFLLCSTDISEKSIQFLLCDYHQFEAFNINNDKIYNSLLPDGSSGDCTMCCEPLRGSVRIFSNGYQPVHDKCGNEYQAKIRSRLFLE